VDRTWKEGALKGWERGASGPTKGRKKQGKQWKPFGLLVHLFASAFRFCFGLNYELRKSAAAIIIYY
jgi:hypothetical protein